MTFEKLEVVNYKAFGEKVKAWAKGAESVPTTLEEFSSQLAQANVGAKIPQNLKYVRFVQDDEETLTVRLPCKATLEWFEKRLTDQGGSYPLPAFYERVFESRPKIDNTLEFQAERIADYSIGMCG